MTIKINGKTAKEAPEEYLKKVVVSDKVTNYITEDNKEFAYWIKDSWVEINGGLVHISFDSNQVLFVNGQKI